MKTFILFEPKRSYAQNAENETTINDYPFDILFASSYTDIFVLSKQYPDSKILLGAGAMHDPSFNRASMPANAVFYAHNVTELEELGEAKYPCIGIAKTPVKLLSMMSGNMEVMEYIPQKAETPNTSSVNYQERDHQYNASQIPTQSPTPKEAPAPAFSEEQYRQFLAFMEAQKAMNQPPAQLTPASQPEYDGDEDDEDDGCANSPVSTPVPKTSQKKQGSILRDNIEAKRAAEARAGIQRSGINIEGLVPEKIKTTTATVYAAKGGVGKTSISAETAYCLACTNNGRRNLRVCVVDYNIDFGDIASTLELDEKGNNMVLWAAEIQEKLDAGKKPDDINFTKHEMEDYYLQRVNNKLQLYALVAPIAHEDSMNISSDSLDVMLRNIIENGEFDFVICDTGNNTRDASVIALSRSDNILLVATQDVTTANCNSAMIRTMRQVTINGKPFDQNKIKLVINNIISSREAGISVEEVEETFPYECIARIKRTPDIIKANNFGKPLVQNPKHEYSKQIFKIVRYLTSGEIEDEPVQEKKSLFSFLKK